jgi:hypothetical protein
VNLRNEQELINTRTKLARLEARYERLRAESGGDEELRLMTMDSLKRTINQFKEEIARYTVGANNGDRNRILNSESELTNTREKLRHLESRHESLLREMGGETELREAESTSLKRLINQLKEEIARYEAHQTAGP